MAECVEKVRNDCADAIGHNDAGTALARRRADTSHPYLGIPVEDLTGEQKRDVQACYVERYQGRLDRAQWGREFRREGGVVKLRIYGTARTRRADCA
jgi:hypothetical protein